MGQGVKGALYFIVYCGLEVKREAFVVVAQLRYLNMVVRVHGACRGRERAVRGRTVPGRLGPGGSWGELVRGPRRLWGWG